MKKKEITSVKLETLFCTKNACKARTNALQYFRAVWSDISGFYENGLVERLEFKTGHCLECMSPEDVVSLKDLHAVEQYAGII